MHTITAVSFGSTIQNDVVRVINDTPRTDPQAFTVYVKDAKDWKEIHDYIIYENNLDDIPNRQISVVSELAFSPKRSVYSMSEDEADVLRNHPKVGLVTYSSMYNEVVLEQAKYDQEHDRLTDAFRFQDTFNSTKFYNALTFPPHNTDDPIDCKTEHISFWRRDTNTVFDINTPLPQGTTNGVYRDLSFGGIGIGSTNPGVGLTFTQWGLHRHSYKENPFKAGYPDSVNGSLDNEVITDKDVAFSLTGKHVDVVIMDSGVIWNHPEFLLPGITTISTYRSTTDSEGNSYDASTEWVKPYTRVRDILLDGKSDYGIDWEAEGLVSAGAGILTAYNRQNVLSQSGIGTDNGHGTHVASTAAGNVFGHAPEANIWSIACVDRSDVGFAEASDGFDYIKVWHKKKPINPVTGRKNPTIVNCSWGQRQFFVYSFASLPYTATFRGTSYTREQIEADNNAAPAIYYINKSGGSSQFFKAFTSKKDSGQASADELYEDPDCKDVILVCAAGNSGYDNGKQDLPLGYGGDGDYENNEITSGAFLYTSGFDNHYNRPGTPAITGIGKPDAVIKVGSIDSTRTGVGTVGIDDGRVGTSGTFGQERISRFSNRGPAVDVLAAGSNIWGAYDRIENSVLPDGYRDPRRPIFDTSLPDDDITRRANAFSCVPVSGTSMATPQVTGVIAQKLQADPSMNRIDVRNWLMSEGSVVVDNEEFWGGRSGSSLPYTPEDAVGVNSVAYWSDDYALRGNNTRILFNPYANNSRASIKGVNISGVSITQL
tara:strand:+ start:24982 stop:27291 length:2310 start_codon:yes stop_codon:yes gene_type:complete